MKRNALEWFVFVVLLGLIGSLVVTALQMQEIRKENTRLASEVAVADSIAALNRSATQAALAQVREVAFERDSIAAEAQRNVTRVETRVAASRDSVAILRRRLESVPDSVRQDVQALVGQYETIIAAKDTIIAARERELAAERLRVSSLDTALAAALVEIDAQDVALHARDAQIANLERALDLPGLLPRGLSGQLIAGVVGLGIGLLAGG